MKHIKLFEQFVNESNLTKKELQEVQDMGYDAKLKQGQIVVKGENPWGDGQKYTFYWDGEAVWSDGKYGGMDYNNDVTTADEFSDAINDPNNWG